MRVFLIPRRTDLSGVRLALTDLSPNAGQKHGTYDGVSQNVYIPTSMDRPDSTVVSGISYVSGSRNTLLTVSNEDANDDTTGGGDDVSATQETAFGLACYLLDRVQPGGLGDPTSPPITFGEANAGAQAILTAIENGEALTAANVSATLETAWAAAGTELVGTSSRSFGSIEDLLRILSGEVYKLPKGTILAEDSGGTGEFYALSTRTALVAAQTPLQVTSQGAFFASGGFLSSDEGGYQARPRIFQTGAFNASLGEGVLAGFRTGVPILNINNAYSSVEVTALKPRALTLDGTAIPSTGIHPVFAAYDKDGNLL